MRGPHETQDAPQSRGRLYQERLGKSASCYALALLFAVASLVPAHAIKLRTHGDWEADAEVIKNKRRCSISNNDTEHYLQMYYMEGDDHFSFQIGSRRWKIPDGETYNYKMQFDDENPWTAEATSGHYTDGSPYIDADVRGRDQILRWIGQFSKSNHLVVSFPGSDVAQWVVDLDGTRDVIGAFAICLDVLLDVSGSPTLKKQ